MQVVEVEIDDEELDIDENPYFKEKIEKIEQKKHVYNILNDANMPKT